MGNGTYGVQNTEYSLNSFKKVNIPRLPYYVSRINERKQTIKFNAAKEC